ncbi:unnamed protein product [Paramecium pentaurelia]|uniref:Tubulin/FtsZ GTPase domain-containing protein n=1 Tax=Paramecium pentaurelia TaxID=43138 RepID=A0A8S1XA26_9CILI|nr:unnamed protein product [Paramecium pentaurelia]
MREIISIHIGQAGIQVGNACWQLFCMEKDIQPNGLWLKGDNIEFGGELFQKISSDKQYEKLIPRQLFIDFQPDAINKIKNSEYRELFHPDNFIVDIIRLFKNFCKRILQIMEEKQLKNAWTEQESLQLIALIFKDFLFSFSWRRHRIRIWIFIIGVNINKLSKKTSNRIFYFSISNLILKYL